MSEECTHDCSSCKANCDHRAPEHEPPHPKSRIRKVIGVVSGKGGVGKSMTSAMLAVSMRRLGYKAGVLDADITGPSIPRLFGVKGPATGDGESINPVCSRTGVEIMSINLLLDDPEAPVVWRGPVIAGAVKQFWQEVVWVSRRTNGEEYPKYTPDFVKLAESYGAKGIRVFNKNEVAAAFEEAKKNTKVPTLIEFIIDPEEMVYPMVKPGGTLEDLIMDC